MALLDIHNLSVSFATRNGAFKAVDGIDLAVESNDVLALSVNQVRANQRSRVFSR